MKKLFSCSILLLIVLFMSSCGEVSSKSPSYFGDWSVQSLAGSTYISAPDNASFIGMKATYSDEQASFGKDEILKPEYEEQELTSEAFLMEYRSQLSEIGISSKTVKTVSINNWTNPGNLLFIKDDQTMFFLWDGNFYELKKENGD